MIGRARQKLASVFLEEELDELAPLDLVPPLLLVSLLAFASAKAKPAVEVTS
jgi:hypothetical protein